MPRIDPLQLLKCLSVLLSPTGGIKSKDEVQRLASLMTKFSKKLVSKCIYIQILKTTKTDLLGMFMAAGGWNLIHTWLSDAIVAKNWPLIQELLELLLMCPVDVERLKTNNCPKLIKGLSKESSNESVKLLASKLVEQWLRIVKGETEAARQQLQVVAVVESKPVDVPQETKSSENRSPVQLEENRTRVESEESRTCVSEPPKVNSEPVEAKSEPVEVKSENVDVRSEPEETAEVKQEVVEVPKPEMKPEVRLTPDVRLTPEIRLEPRVDLQKLKPGKDFIIKADNTVVCENYGEEAAPNELPVYKITIRDGKQVLAKVSSSVEKSSKRLDEDDESTDFEEETLVKPVTKTYSRASNNIDQFHCVKKETEADVKPAIINDVKSSPVKTKVKSEKLENNVESPKLSKDAKKNKEIQPSNKVSDKKSKSVEKKESEKDREKDKERDKEKDKNKEKLKQKENKQKDKKPSSEKLDAQAERDKATLAKLIPPAISKLGKIPKKPKVEDPSKESPKPIEIKKPGGEVKKLPPDVKKPPPPPEPSSRKASISIEVRKPVDGASRPKTVKTFNSKFRSTGLEEEVKPPPPRPIKKNASPLVEKRPPLKLPNLKRPSPPKDMLVPPEKKLKPTVEAAVEEPKKIEKPAAIKPIAAKPKPSFLQESDMFMDALNASSKKEPRKRKRRIASSNEGPEAKKEPVAAKEEESNKETTPPSSPANNENGKSPPLVRPTFKFYQDTLETNEEEKPDETAKSTEPKEGDDAEEANEEERRTPSPQTDETEGSPKANDDTSEVDNVKDEASEEKSEDSDEAKEKDIIDISLLGGKPKGVLIYHKTRKGPKKVVRWKTEKDLETIKYFELDETERVNVTKNFMDMKQMERTHEREAFLLARKLPQVDTMEEKIPWQPLIPIDLPPNLVEPGKNSREKDVQYAREKVILQALYFNRNMIPDSAAEPDLEIHPTTDPVIIPLDDVTGNPDSINDFQNTPWPEPKPMIIPQSPPPQFQQPQPAFNQFPSQSFPSQQVFPNQGSLPNNGQGPGGMMVPNSMNNMSLPAAGGDWRTGDGKVIPVNEMPMQMDMYSQPGPPMGMPGIPGPGMPLLPGPGPEMNYSMMGEDMGPQGPFPPQGFPMAGPHGPPGPAMFPFRGNRGGMRGGRGNNNQMGPRGPGGPWFRPMGGGNWQPPPVAAPAAGPVRRGGRGGWNPNRGICKHFRGGFCRQGDKCSFLHPGVNDLHQF